jgi:hypothetical protein
VIDSTTLYAKSVDITRQASEIDITALSDTKILSAPGRVKRGGSAEVYVGTGDAAIVSAVESANLTSPPVLTFAGESIKIHITGADKSYSGDGAAMWKISFVETVALT